MKTDAGVFGLMADARAGDADLYGARSDGQHDEHVAAGGVRLLQRLQRNRRVLSVGGGRRG